MAFRKDPPTIPLSLLQWEAVGDEADPKARLLAHIRIGEVDMHLEAWQVYRDENEGQHAEPGSLRSEELDALINMMGSDFETGTIEDREYVFIATPYGY